jgi:hypothetical protein
MAGTVRHRRDGIRARASGHTHWASLLIFCAAAACVIQFYHPPQFAFATPWSRAGVLSSIPDVTPAAYAFGASHEVRVRFALPAARVEIPLEIGGNPAGLSYRWVRLADSVPSGIERPLEGADFIAPAEPGFYHLAVLQGAQQSIVDSLTITVLVPFSAKLGATLNGYKIGTYLAERRSSANAERPDGFVQVSETDVDLPVSTHLRLSDFITHDEQVTWPRYAAVSPLLLDKIELVLTEIADARGAGRDVRMEMDVHSGFRTPLHNRRVPQSASESRHQYGDAADLAIDANGDGRYSAADCKLVAAAVDKVELAHPELVGGLGIYTSRRYSTPYVHIDTRGTLVRWRE